MRFLPIIILLLFKQLSAQNLPITIDEMAAMPEAVTNNAVCEGFINDNAYVFSFGGIDTSLAFSGIHNRSYKYDVANDTWSSIASLPDAGKIAMAASRIDDIIYIMGGYYVASNGSETSSDKVHRYDVINNVFLSDGAPIPVPIDDHVQVVYNNELIYLITGWSDNQNVNNVQIYNPSSNTWQVGTSTPNNNLYETFGSSGTIIGNTIYYHGGAQNGGSFPISFQLRKGEIDVTDPTQITWSVDTLEMALSSYRSTALTIEDTMLFVGGSNTTYNFDGIAYNNSGIVNPAQQAFAVYPGESYVVDTSVNVPMDLRGNAKTEEKVFFLAGGILNNQQVSDQLLRLTWRLDTNTVSINTLEDAAIAVFPNPAQVRLYIKNVVANGMHYTICDTQGKALASGNYLHSEGIFISSLPKGTYYLKFPNTATRVFIKN